MFDLDFDASPEEQHLIETFYITKPPIQPVETPRNASLSAVSVSPPPQTPHTQSQYRNLNTCPVPSRLNRVAKMIKHQVYSTAAVPVALADKSNQPLRKSRKNFVKQFQDFFKTFVKEPTPEEQKRKVRRSQPKRTLKKSKKGRSENRIRRSCLDDYDSFEERKIEEKTAKTFHGKMRQGIDKMMKKVRGGAGGESLKRIEMPEDKLDRKKIGKSVKEKQEKVPRDYYKLTRSGLQIHEINFTPKSRLETPGFVEHNRIKKDQAFRKGLNRNCEVIMKDLEAYQQGEKTFRQTISHERRKISKKTPKFVERLHEKQTLHRSTQDIQNLKWQERYIGVELECQKGLQGSRPLKKGVRAFRRFVDHVSGEFQRSQKTLTRMARGEEEMVLYEPVNYDDMAEMDKVLMETARLKSQRG